MSALVVKTVTGTLKYGDGSVWPSGLIVFEPVAVFGATPVTVPIEQIKVYSGANGTFTVDLLTFDDTAVTYDCTLPSGDTFRFNLPAGAGSTTLETLRGSAYVPTAPSYDHGALTGLGDDDHPHYLNNTRGDARYAAIGHNHSGVYSPVGHGHTAADVSDFAATVRGTVLTGLGAGSNTAIEATDTILAAFAKLQNQITNIVGMEIGAPIEGSPTAGSVLFVGAGGVLAQSTQLSLASDTVNQVFTTVTGADGSWTKFGKRHYQGFCVQSSASPTFTLLTPDDSMAVQFNALSSGSNPVATFVARTATQTALKLKMASSYNTDILQILGNDDTVLSRFDLYGRLKTAYIDALYGSTLTIGGDSTYQMNLSSTVLAMTNFTEGSIPYFGASGVVTQSNENLHYDHTNGMLTLREKTLYYPALRIAGRPGQGGGGFISFCLSGYGSTDITNIGSSLGEISGVANVGLDIGSSGHIRMTRYPDLAAVYVTTPGSILDWTLKVENGLAGKVGLLLKMASSQTANPFEVRNSSDVLCAYFSVPGVGRRLDFRIPGYYSAPDGVTLHEHGLKITNTGYGTSIELVSNYGNTHTLLHSTLQWLVAINGYGAYAIGADANATAGNTRLMVYDVDNGQLERVSVGAPDSGGTGYKVLRIPN